MDSSYSSYGLRLVANGRIPGLAPRTGSDPHDVRIWLGEFPSVRDSDSGTIWYESPQYNGEGRRNLTITRQMKGFHFAYNDQTEFLINAEGTGIWCKWSDKASIADAAVHLRGPILGFVLRLRGTVSLHASAIAVGSAAIAIVAAAGGGKSTTAASFSKLGLRVIADDVVALKREESRLLVLPGNPRLNLWPDAAESLYGESRTLPRLIPRGGVNDWWDKRYLDLDWGGEFHAAALPLRAVYVLGDRSSVDGPPAIEEISSQDAFIWLTDGTHVNYAIDETMREIEFELLGHLVRTTPVRLVTPSNNRARLPELCEAILDDFRQITANTPIHV
jgi:hypothetical protein